jgi:hypothetical protein
MKTGAAVGETPVGRTLILRIARGSQNGVFFEITSVKATPAASLSKCELAAD